MTFPPWWAWELELTPHIERRMEERGFNEVDLRQMLDAARAIRHDIVEGRFVAETSHEGRRWEAILEPDPAARVIVVVTAYPVE